MVPMSVEEIAKAVDGRLIGDAGSESRATNTCLLYTSDAADE